MVGAREREWLGRERERVVGARERAVASEDLKHDAPLDADDDDDVGDRVEREVMVGFLGDL